MEYRKLGTSGTIVTAYCLGTMTFGAEADEAASHKLLDDYFAWGGNFIDTADVYSAGVSEEIIGRWLKARPTEALQAIIATKVDSRWEQARTTSDFRDDISLRLWIIH